MHQRGYLIGFFRNVSIVDYWEENQLNLTFGPIEMKKMNRPAFLLFWIIIVSMNAIGQVGNEVAFIEKINLFTDRSLYIAGEQIHFSAFISPNDQQQTNWSKVLYIELISPDGKSMARNKISISDHLAEGCLVVPADIISGVYYVRAY